MSARAIWKGSLKLSLVTIPIRVFPATDPAGDISFRQIHRRCGTPIQLRKWCPHCEAEVSADEIAKGYVVRKGEFVLIEQEDINAVRPKSTHTIDVDRIVDASTLDPLLIERPYYVAPDSQTAGSAFTVVRDALGADRAAVGKVAIHGREYLVALRPRDAGFVMFTLRHADEVRAMDAIDELSFAKDRAASEELKLARRILDSFQHGGDLSQYHDDYEDALRKMIKAKAEGKTVSAPEEPRPAKVVNLMDALRRSLGEVEARGRKASTGRQRPARMVSHPAKSRRAKRAS
jgi:DNA end-binding protein Ku